MSEPGFAHRGVIEGYYGAPYTHADRLWLLERMGAWGMNRYVYAPKDDPFHRARWRSEYSGAAVKPSVDRGRLCGRDRHASQAGCRRLLEEL